jgi:hypothetical protein
LSWIFSPESQLTVWVVGMGLLDGEWRMAEGVYSIREASHAYPMTHNP